MIRGYRNGGPDFAGRSMFSWALASFGWRYGARVRAKTSFVTQAMRVLRLKIPPLALLFLTAVLMWSSSRVAPKFSFVIPMEGNTMHNLIPLSLAGLVSVGIILI